MSRYKCCVPGCRVKKDDGIALHCFPNPKTNPEKFKIWVSSIDGLHKYDMKVISKNLRVCRKHFRKIYHYPKNHLSKIAFPELLLPGVSQKLFITHYSSGTTDFYGIKSKFTTESQEENSSTHTTEADIHSEDDSDGPQSSKASPISNEESTVNPMLVNPLKVKEPPKQAPQLSKAIPITNEDSTVNPFQVKEPPKQAPQISKASPGLSKDSMVNPMPVNSKPVKPLPVKEPPKQVLQLRLINENVCDEPVYEVLIENDKNKKQIATQTAVREEILPEKDSMIKEKVTTKTIPSQNSTPTKENEIQLLQNEDCENNKEYWKLKLKSILHNTQFCGICLDNGVEMSSLNDDLEIIFYDKTHNKSLGDIVSKVFKEDEYYLANSQICNKCTKKLIQSYIFIHKTEETLQTLNRYLNELYDKTCYIRNNSLNDTNNVNSIFNVVIALDNKAIEQFDTQIKIESDVDENEEPTLTFVEKSSPVKRKYQSDSVQSTISQTQSINWTQSIKRTQSINRTQSIKQTQSINWTPTTKQTQTIIQTRSIPQSQSIQQTQIISQTKSINQTKTIKLSSHYYPMFNKQNNRCEICLQTYKTNYDLAKHYNQHLKPRCTFCHKTVKEGQMLAHLKRWHKHLIHLCPTCNIVFYCEEDLDVHVKESHFTSENKCVMCHNSLSSDRSEDHQCKYKCPECLIQPCVHHKYIKCYRKQVSNLEPRAKCLDCSYVCQTIETLISHVNKIHLKRLSHKCKKCKQKFFSEYDLKKHICRPIRNKYLHICENCGKEFNNTYYLNRHINSCKYIQRSFQCDDCSFNFDTAKEHLNHMRLIHGKDKLACTLCDRVFLNHLKKIKHEKQAHGMYKNTFNCVVCQAKFLSKAALQLHLKYHGPDAKSLKSKIISKNRKLSFCDVCDRVITRTLYKKHMLSHSLTVFCPTCGESFKNSSVLKYHKKVHSNTMTCPRCDKVMSSAKIWRHYRNHLIKDSLNFKLSQ